MNENINRKEVKNMNLSETADRIFINAVDEYNLYVDLSRNICEIALPLNNNSTRIGGIVGYVRKDAIVDIKKFIMVK